MASDDSTKTPFVLDDRDLDWHFRRWQIEAEKQEFQGEQHWDRVWFPQGVQSLLAKLQKAPMGDLAPHQAFLLAFLQQMNVPQSLFNSVLPRHRDLYYREMLGLTEQAPLADRVVVGAELVSNVTERLISAGTLLDGGQDAQQTPQYYAVEQSTSVNAGRLSDLFWFEPGVNGMPGYSIKVLSESDSIAWPEGGLRLFEKASLMNDAADAPVEQQFLGGRVIASAALSLNRGERTLELTFTTTPELPGSLLAWVTAGGQWYPLEANWTDGKLVLSLGADAPSIEAAPDLDGWPSDVPLLKLVHRDGLFVPAVSSFTLNVIGASDILMSTDEGPAEINKPFYPFGPEPKQGNAFYITSSDWVKPAGKLTLTLIPEWVGLPPESFTSWYANYKSIDGKELYPPMSNSSFKLEASIRSSDKAGIISSEQRLFDGKDTDIPITRKLELKEFSPLTRALPDSGDPRDGECLCLALSGQNFRHEEYWYHLTTARPDDPGPVWKPPRTAQLRQMQVNYTYSYELDGQCDTQIVLTPFGYAALPPLTDQRQLFLGWDGVRPGQELSLYWKLRSPRRQMVRWSYLRQDNSWVSLDTEIHDDTQGLSRSGLWRTRLPLDATDQAAAMPLQRYWLRGIWTLSDEESDNRNLLVTDTKTSDPANTPWLYGMLSNALTALRVEGEKPVLPAGTISQSVENIDGIQGFIQPWPSEGGRAMEDSSQFMERIARRLDNRRRIVSRRDIPALLLEYFPMLYDAHLDETLTDADFTLGRGERLPLQVVVIPRPQESDTIDPLRPKFNAVRLEEMKKEISRRASLWLDFELINPLYQDVKVRYQLSFRDGISPDFGYQQVHDALAVLYMPWGEDSSDKAVTLGVDLDYYELLTAIQGLPWVEEVDQLTLDGQQNSIAAAPLQVLILDLDRLEQADIAETVSNSSGSTLPSPSAKVMP